MIVILQLSDLHRSSADPVGNAELIAALQSDQSESTNESWAPTYLCSPRRTRALRPATPERSTITP